MKPCTRGPGPEFLRAHGAEWSRDFAARRGDDPTARFSWKSYEGTSVLPTIRAHLGEMTQQHCAYCDGYPLHVTGLQTVDHFQPKSKFPLLAYVWENLFLACEKCQRHKGDQDAAGLLRPDDPGYRFENFFDYQEKTGELRPNPAAPEPARARVQVTIDTLGLNRDGRPVARRKTLHRFRGLTPAARADDPICDWPFRFLLGDEVA